MEEQQQHNKVLVFALVGVALLLVVGGVYYLTTRSGESPAPETEEEITEEPGGGITTGGTEMFETASGLTFTYPDTYTAVSPEMLDLSAEEVVNLFDKDDYRELMESTEPREGPTAITLQVFDNPENQAAGEWIMEHAQTVNYNPDLGRLQPREIAREDGVAYRFTGLYEGDAAAFTAGGKLYLFTVTWMGPNDQIREDFEGVLSSISVN